MSPQLKQVLTEIDRLSPTEQMEVLSHTITQMKQNLLVESNELLAESPENSLDSDIGLVVKPEVIEQLLAISQSSNPTFTTDQVKQRLGLV